MCEFENEIHNSFYGDKYINQQRVLWKTEKTNKFFKKKRKCWINNVKRKIEEEDFFCVLKLHTCTMHGFNETYIENEEMSEQKYSTF